MLPKTNNPVVVKRRLSISMNDPFANIFMDQNKAEKVKDENNKVFAQIDINVEDALIDTTRNN